MTELPQVPSPRCIHLYSKAMAVHGEGFEDDPDFQAGLTERARGAPVDPPDDRAGVGHGQRHVAHGLEAQPAT